MFEAHIEGLDVSIKEMLDFLGKKRGAISDALHYWAPESAEAKCCSAIFAQEKRIATLRKMQSQSDISHAEWEHIMKMDLLAKDPSIKNYPHVMSNHQIGFFTPASSLPKNSIEEIILTK